MKRTFMFHNSKGLFLKLHLAKEFQNGKKKTMDFWELETHILGAYGAPCSPFGSKHLFETDILLYMNLYRAKKMFGRDILLYMNLYRAKKIVWERHFTLYKYV